MRVATLALVAFLRAGAVARFDTPAPARRGALPAAGFLAADFFDDVFAAGFLADCFTVCLLAADCFTAGFLVTGFFVTGFLAADCFAADLFKAAFFAPLFFTAATVAPVLPAPAFFLADVFFGAFRCASGENSTRNADGRAATAAAAARERR